MPSPSVLNANDPRITCSGLEQHDSALRYRPASTTNLDFVLEPTGESTGYPSNLEAIPCGSVAFDPE
jgi:hypothetical protein